MKKYTLRALLPVCAISVNLTFGNSCSTPLSLGEITRAASSTCSLPASPLPLKSSTMSLYTQNGYGQVSYGGPSYTQTSGYYQPPTPPTPFYHVDPNAFRRDYASRLAELTVNSRPIIQNLSMIAQEYTRFSEIVAHCLEAHIRRVSSVHFSLFLSYTVGCCVIFG